MNDNSQNDDNSDDDVIDADNSLNDNSDDNSDDDVIDADSSFNDQSDDDLLDADNSLNDNSQNDDNSDDDVIDADSSFNDQSDDDGIDYDGDNQDNDVIDADIGNNSDNSDNSDDDLIDADNSFNDSSSEMNDNDLLDVDAGNDSANGDGSANNGSTADNDVVDQDAGGNMDNDGVDIDAGNNSANGDGSANNGGTADNDFSDIDNREDTKVYSEHDSNAANNGSTINDVDVNTNVNTTINTDNSLTVDGWRCSVELDEPAAKRDGPRLWRPGRSGGSDQWRSPQRQHHWFEHFQCSRRVHQQQQHGQRLDPKLAVVQREQLECGQLSSDVYSGKRFAASPSLLIWRRQRSCMWSGERIFWGVFCNGYECLGYFCGAIYDTRDGGRCGDSRRAISGRISGFSGGRYFRF